MADATSASDYQKTGPQNHSLQHQNSDETLTSSQWSRGKRKGSSGKMIQKRNIYIAGLFSLDAASRRIPLTYSAPHPEEEEKCGVLQKLKACDSDLDDLWELRRVVLSDKLLCFTPLESYRTVSDCIPIHEISQVAASLSHSGNLSAAHWR